MAGECWLVLATEEDCGLNSDLAKDFVFGIDHIPLALDFVRLGGKRLHVLLFIGSRRTARAEGAAN